MCSSDLALQRIDLDSYLPQGMSALATGHEANWLSALTGLIQGGADFEKRVTLALNELRLNGVAARDVAVDVNSGLRGLEVKRLDVGSVNGASVAASGTVLSGVDGPDGGVNASIRADDPTGLLRLLGLAGEGAAWTRGLGQTDLALALTLKPGPQEPVTSYSVTGRSGTLDVSLSGGFSALAKGVDATVNLRADVGSAEGADIARLFGLSPPAPSAAPGKLTLTLIGSRAEGFATTLDAAALGATAHYDGRVQQGLWPEGEFRLEAPEAGAVLAASGVPLMQPAAGRVDITGSAVAGQGEAPATATFTGHWGTAEFSGTVNRDLSGAKPRYVARLKTGALTLADVLGPGFLPWTGAAPGTTSVLAASLPTERSYEIWLTPAAFTLAPGIVAREAEVGISIGDTERRLALNGRDAADNVLSLDLATTPDGEVQNVTAQFALPVRLAQTMALADGTVLMDGSLMVEGKVAARGRSAMAVISSANGSGSYRLTEARLTRLSPQLLPVKLAGISDAAGLTAALDEVRLGPGLMLGAARGGLAVKDGIATLDPMTFPAPGSTITVASAADFGAGAVAAEIKVQPGEGSELPAYGVAYAGEPGALVERDDFGALASKLGVKLLEQSMAALEKARAEQEKMAAQEQAQRAADQARFEQWQATRAELRQRQREIRVLAEIRAGGDSPWPKVMPAPAPEPADGVVPVKPVAPPAAVKPASPLPRIKVKPVAPKPAPAAPPVEIIKPPVKPSTRVIVVPP